MLLLAAMRGLTPQVSGIGSGLEALGRGVRASCQSRFADLLAGSIGQIRRLAG
jgi:hypothetical protein